MGPEYSVRPMAAEVFEVAKFDGHKWPDEVYIVKPSMNMCSCPAGPHHPSCKHRRIVEEYRKLGQPIMNCFWLDRLGRIQGCVADVTDEWRKELEGGKRAIRKVRSRKHGSGKARTRH